MAALSSRFPSQWPPARTNWRRHLRLSDVPGAFGHSAPRVPKTGQIGAYPRTFGRNRGPDSPRESPARRQVPAALLESARAPYKEGVTGSSPVPPIGWIAAAIAPERPDYQGGIHYDRQSVRPFNDRRPVCLSGFRRRPRSAAALVVAPAACPGRVDRPDAGGQPSVHSRRPRAHRLPSWHVSDRQGSESRGTQGRPHPVRRPRAGGSRPCLHPQPDGEGVRRGGGLASPAVRPPRPCGDVHEREHGGANGDAALRGGRGALQHPRDSASPGPADHRCPGRPPAPVHRPGRDAPAGS